ncbi:hypothetical protein GCK32_017677 [Trichostrongylus colubriformis]|uniref:Uncharacterized protein n=1 Tax=Trichostrongylus colubriformis TaxID=6319 RepID=A0AAN8IS92_TRICO
MNDSSVIQNVTSSGTGRTTRMISSETNIWAPTGGTSASKRHTGTSGVPSKNESSPTVPSVFAEPPADVYELRRRLERAREYERARAMMMEQGSREQDQGAAVVAASVPGESKSPAAAAYPYLQGLRSRDGREGGGTQL